MAGALVALMIGGVQAQQVDMAAVQRWSNAKVVRYQIVGEFDGWTPVSGTVTAQDRSGEVQATDKLTLGFDWDVREERVVGKATIDNAASTVKGTRNKIDPRVAPVLKGAYDHLKVTEVRATDAGGRVDLIGTRTYPAAELALGYPSSMAMKPVAQETATVTEFLAMPDPALMGMAGFMPVQTTGTGTQLAFTADQKSFVMKMNGWTWTYTPTILE
jgi:hypothetical protein